jgi:hypothetical protein
MLELTPYRHRLLDLRSRARGLLANKEEIILKPALRTSGISMTAFGFGVLQGRFADKGGVSLFNVPVDLLAGVAFHAVALFANTGYPQLALQAFGDGALASFFNSAGYRVGDTWRKKGGGISGLFGDSSSKQITGGSSLDGSIAESEMANLVMSE